MVMNAVRRTTEEIPVCIVVEHLTEQRLKSSVEGIGKCLRILNVYKTRNTLTNSLKHTYTPGFNIHKAHAKKKQYKKRKT